MTCPHCQFVNPGTFNFCGNCGARLRTSNQSPVTSDQSPVTSDQSSVTSDQSSVTSDQSSVTSDQSSVTSNQSTALAESERRRVTILFADVSGFTAMSEKMDPEEVYRLMNRCFARLGDAIAKFEGTVDKFIGDCVMALFGAPIAHENDPERAIRAAVEMQEQLGDFARELEQRTGIRLRMRVGLNSGMVIAGAVGSNQTQQYTVMGDAVNLASRIESAATPGGVLVSESVYRQTHRHFEFKAWEPIRVKGKEQPVRVYEVLGARSEPGAAKLRRQHATLVGRRDELRVLVDSLDRAAMGRGSIINVLGAAGLGKSRLLDEFSDHVAERGLICLRHVCQAHEDRIAYRAWRGLFAQLCGLEDDDDAEQEATKISETLAAIDTALIDWMPQLADVFGLTGRDDTDALTRKRVTQQAVRHVMLALAAKHSLTLVIDDAQWTDPLSAELFALMMNDTATSRLLLIAAQRPDATSSLLSAFVNEGGKRSTGRQREGALTITLAPMNATESAQLAAAALGGSGSPPALTTLLVERAGGNPFFVEELAQALVESGALTQEDGKWIVRGDLRELALPETLEAVLTARIDRLARDAKQTLQCASVIGREVPVNLLQRVSPIDGDLPGSLLQLQSAEFVEESSPPPRWGFSFVQALIQQVAYHMMLIQRRQTQHERVARAIEELHAARLEDHLEALAHHYARTENRPKAITYLAKAGEKALRLFSTADAKTFLTEALNLIALLPSSEYNERRGEELRCHEALGDVATLTGDYAEATKRHLQVLQSHHEALPSDRGRLKRKLGNVHTRQADFAEAVRYLREGLADVEGDATDQGRREVAKIWSELAGVSYRTGSYAEAAEQAIRGLEMAEAVNGRKEIGDCCNVYGLVQHGAGDFDRADALFRRSFQIREESGDLVGMASALNNLGIIAVDRGRYREADDFYRRSFELREKMAHHEGMATTLVNRGYVTLNLGRYQEAERLYRQALEIAHRLGNANTAAAAALNIGLAQLQQGDQPSALTTLREAREAAQRHAFQDLISLADSVIAMTHIAGGDGQSAITHAQEALTLAHHIGSKYHQAFALRTLGAAQAASGERETAIDSLQASLALFAEMNAEHECGRTCAELARVDGDSGTSWRERAREIFARLEAAGDLARLESSLSPATRH